MKESDCEFAFFGRLLIILFLLGFKFTCEKTILCSHCFHEFHLVFFCDSPLGTTTLKNALGDKNITVDNVEDALADVREILETNADIQFALSGAQFNDIINDGTDDETLESELMDLLEEDEQLDVDVVKDADGNLKLTQPNSSVNEHKRNPSNYNYSPTTITNIIDELLEERLNKLKLDNSFNVSIDKNDNPHIKVHSTSFGAQNIGL